MSEDSKRSPTLLDRAAHDPLVSILAGWLIPGAGHIVADKIKKGIFFFLAGLLLADFRTVRYSDNPFYYVGQVGSGLNLLLTALCTDLKPQGRMPQIYFEPGLLYMSVSGLLNILVIMAIHQTPESETKDKEEEGDPQPARAGEDKKKT